MLFRFVAVSLSFFLSVSLGTLIDDRELAQFLSDEEEANNNVRLLDGADGHIMERCGNRNPCADNLECSEMAVGKRCFPKECFSRKAQQFAEQGFDAAAYKEMIFAKAGFTEEQVIGARASAKDDKAFTSSNIFESVMKALQENSEPLQKILDMEQSCTSPGEEYISPEPRNDTAGNSTTPIPPANGLQHVDYFGMQVEFGALADFSYSYFQPNTPGGPRLVNRFCLGAGPQAEAHVSMLAGRLVNSRNGRDLCCASIWADVDIIAIYGIGVAGGFAFNGRAMYEATIGFGAGIGGGASTCVAFATT